MKSKILILATVLIMLCQIASADVLNQPVQDDMTGALDISGQIDGYGYADAFTLAVFKADKSYATITDYTPAQILGAMTHFGTYMTDSEGNYSVNFSTKGLNAGDYRVVLTTKDGTKYEKAIFVASRDSKIKFIEDVAKLVENGCTAQELKAMLGIENATTVNSKVFELLEDNIIFTVDADAFTAIVLHNIKETENFDKTTPEDFVSLLEDCATIQSVNEGKLNPAEKAEFFELDEDYLKTYENSLSDEIKEAFADNFKDGGYKTKKMIADRFIDVVLVAVLEDADSWKDYKNIIEKHGEDIGVDMKAYKKLTSTKKDKISSYMANSYDDVKDFVEDVNDAIEDVNSSKGSGGGGSSSGRGTSGITGTDAIYYPIDMTPKAETVKFTDLDGYDWAKDAINALSDDGVISGMGGGVFAPESPVTREQFVKMVVLALQIPLYQGDADFADLEKGAWYQQYVKSAVENGVINGVGNGNFGIGSNITREDVAVILYRAAKLTAADGKKDFTDADSISEYAVDSVNTLASMEVIGGMDDGSFAPKSICTRAQAATMIYRLLGKLGK